MGFALVNIQMSRVFGYTSRVVLEHLMYFMSHMSPNVSIECIVYEVCRLILFLLKCKIAYYINFGAGSKLMRTYRFRIKLLKFYNMYYFLYYITYWENEINIRIDYRGEQPNPIHHDTRTFIMQFFKGFLQCW